MLIDFPAIPILFSTTPTISGNMEYENDISVATGKICNGLLKMFELSVDYATTIFHVGYL